MSNSILSSEQLDELQKVIPELEKVWIYDTEVFRNDWLLIFEQVTTGEKKIFHNDNYAVEQFLDSFTEDNRPLLGGFNTKHYDKWILRAIYHGAENEKVKGLNDYIIKDGHSDAWNYPEFSGKYNHPCQQFDLMDDIKGTSLKEIEGNLGMDIEETEIDFDLDRALTEDELNKTIKYCTHDVEATIRLLYERKNYLASKINVGTMKSLSVAESIGMTNGKLTGIYLDAKYEDRQDDTEYDFPNNLVIDKYLNVIKFFGVIDPDYKKELNIEIAGVPHTIAWGGLHGALENYSEESTEARKVMHIDVTSYYPSLMIQNHYLSRSVPEPDEFKRVYERRVEAKKAGDKATANALKLILNTTYGVMKQGLTSDNPYSRNVLYDPRMANAVCISGQLYLIDLIEKLETVPTFKLIQSNTDGLIVSYDKEYEDDVNIKVLEWEARTGFHMGFDEIEKIVQKDVNNYIMRSNGEIEVKGGYVSSFDGGNFKNKDLVIVAKAIVANLLDGTPPEETINGCTDIEQFQIVCKAGHTYDKVVWISAGQEIEVQNVNRVYASQNKDSGTIYKIKLAHDSQKERRDKIANLPDHCIIDNKALFQIAAIDKQFYINLAQKRINDYLGIKTEKPKKERKRKSMSTRKTDNTPETEKTEQQENPTTAAPAAETPNTIATQIAAPLITEKGFGAKLMKLRAEMNKFQWEKDGTNRHQSYTYFTEAQYKNNFKKALAAAELDFKASMLDYQFIPNATDKMSMIIAKFQFEIIDRDNGEREVYPAFGSGADMGDKGLYKAYTGAIKYFLANNFLVAEGSDPESDEEETRQEKPKYTPPEKREEIKDKLKKNDGPATDVQIETIANGIAMMEEAGVDDDVISSFNDLLASDMTAAEAQEAIESINTLLESAA